MAITTADLKFYQAERMTDNDDGGGQMSGNEIVSGASNQIFDDVSDVDRAAGDLSLRKLYVSVTSADTDKYLDSGVVVFKPPTDTNTSVIAFSTGDYYDERASIQSAVEQYRVPGVDTRLRLIGTHYVNQRVLYGYLLQPISRDINSTFYNQVLVLSDENHTQYVRVVRVRYWAAQYVYLNNGNQTLYDVYEVMLDLAGRLEYAFAGSEQNPSGSYIPPTTISTTQVIAPLTFCGVQALVATGSIGDLTLTVEDVAQQIVPVAYADLGVATYTSTAESCKSPYVSGESLLMIPMNQDVAAPDGFTLDVTLSPPLLNMTGVSLRIAYRYGDAWIDSDHPNAATYLNGTIYFPSLPDGGSRVYMEWAGRNEEIEYLTTNNGVYSGTLAVTPIDPGSLLITYNNNTSYFQAVDDGNGSLVGIGVTGTINYASGAITLTMPYFGESYEIATAAYTSNDSSYARTDFSVRLYDPVGADTIEVTATKRSDGLALTATDDGQGVVSGTGVTGAIDYLTGLLTLTFDEAVLASSLSVLYHVAGLVPQPKEVLGIDVNRLPKSGKVPVYSEQQFVLVHHTDTIAENSLSPTQVIDCGRVRLYRVVIDDTNGQRLPGSFYTVNRETGIVTMAANLDLTGYSGPYTIQHTIGDLVRLNQVQAGANRLTLNKALSHEFPADTSKVSSVLFIGTLQARYTNLFAQSTWTSVWSDSRIGDAPLAQYNDTAYPIEVSNAGAYKDRILIKFTSSTAFQVIGEQLGVIATGNVNEDCSPVNQLTGQPYFTLDYRGWGSGWSTGNCVRFNLLGANYPIDLVRAIQPSDPTGLDDSVELLFIGNTDAP